MQLSKPNRSLLIACILTALTLVYIAKSDSLPSTHYRFATSYADYPEPKPAPEGLPRALVEVPGTIQAFDISPDETQIAIAARNKLIIYDLNSLQTVQTLQIFKDLGSVAWSPDGRNIAVIDRDIEDYGNGYIHLFIFNTDTWAISYEYQNSASAYVYGLGSSLAWSPNGKRIALTLPESGLTVLDIQQGGIAASMPDLAYQPGDISWSPDSSRLIANEFGFGLRRWRLDVNKWVRLYDPGSQPASRIAWSPDGKHIASGHYGGTICLWNTGNNTCEGFIRAHFNSVDGLDWSPDGKFIATSSGAIRIWDVNTGAEKSAFGYAPSGTYYTQLEWLKDGRIATLESNYTVNAGSIIRIWDQTSGDAKTAFRGWQQMQSPNYDGVVLSVDDIRISKQQTEIYASLKFDYPQTYASNWTLTLRDKNGKIIPLRQEPTGEYFQNNAAVFHAAPLQKDESFTLELHSKDPQGFLVERNISDMPGIFYFNPSTLAVGESVEMNQEIYAADDLFYLTRVERISESGLRFEFFTSGRITGALLNAIGSTATSTTSDGRGRFSATLAFSSMPKSDIEILVVKIRLGFAGPWAVEFNTYGSMYQP